MLVEWIVSAVTVVVLLALGVLAARAIDRRIAARTERDQAEVEPTELSRQRVRTAQLVLRSLLIGIVVVLSLGAAASILGVADFPVIAIVAVSAVLVAFSGASWGSDIVAGFSIVLGGQYYEGDWVDVKRHEIVGQVEGLSLRATTIRALDGTRWVLPNGEMRVSGNRTYDYSRYLFILRVSYDDDVETAIDTLEQSFAALQADPRYGPLVSRLRILGVDDYGSSGIDIKLYLQTVPGAHWRVGREFRRRLKPALDDAGVHIPYEHREVILREAASAAPSPDAASGA